LSHPLSFSKPENEVQIFQPPAEGMQAGGLNPPEPVGIPLGRTAPADISFSTSPQLHSGQAGGSVSEEKTSCSNR
jgi:hypothetical protein